MVPTRNGLQLRINHRGGKNGQNGQSRADIAQSLPSSIIKHSPQSKHPHDQQTGNSQAPLTAQPAATPLRKGLQKPLRIAQMKGRGQKPAHRQRKGQSIIKKRHPAAHIRQAKPQPSEQAKAQTRSDSEEYYRTSRMHQSFSKALSSHPRKPFCVPETGSK